MLHTEISITIFTSVRHDSQWMILFYLIGNLFGLLWWPSIINKNLHAKPSIPSITNQNLIRMNILYDSLTTDKSRTNLTTSFAQSQSNGLANSSRSSGHHHNRSLHFWDCSCTCLFKRGHLSPHNTCNSHHHYQFTNFKVLEGGSLSNWICFQLYIPNSSTNNQRKMHNYTSQHIDDQFKSHTRLIHIQMQITHFTFFSKVNQFSIQSSLTSMINELHSIQFSFKGKCIIHYTWKSFAD